MCTPFVLEEKCVNLNTCTHMAIADLACFCNIGTAFRSVAVSRIRFEMDRCIPSNISFDRSNPLTRRFDGTLLYFILHTRGIDLPSVSKLSNLVELRVI